MLQQEQERQNLLVVLLHPFLIGFFFYFFILFFFYYTFTNAIRHPWSAGGFLTPVNDRTEQINMQVYKSTQDLMYRWETEQTYFFTWPPIDTRADSMFRIWPLFTLKAKRKDLDTSHKLYQFDENPN